MKKDVWITKVVNRDLKNVWANKGANLKIEHGKFTVTSETTGHEFTSRGCRMWHFNDKVVTALPMENNRESTHALGLNYRFDDWTIQYDVSNYGEMSRTTRDNIYTFMSAYMGRHVERFTPINCKQHSGYCVRLPGSHEHFNHLEDPSKLSFSQDKKLEMVEDLYKSTKGVLTLGYSRLYVHNAIDRSGYNNFISTWRKI